MSNSRLVYKTDISEIGLTFDKLLKEKNLSLIFPYISYNYIEKLNVKEDWRLITDYYELLKSTPKLDLDKMGNFLIENQKKKQVIHLGRVHAKVIISSNSAYLGSANLTISGAMKRDEMGIVLKGKNKLNELKKWVDDLWSDGEIIKKKIVKKFIKNLKEDKSVNIPKSFSPKTLHDFRCRR